MDRTLQDTATLQVVTNGVADPARAVAALARVVLDLEQRVAQLEAALRSNE